MTTQSLEQNKFIDENILSIEASCGGLFVLNLPLNSTLKQKLEVIKENLEKLSLKNKLEKGTKFYQQLQNCISLVKTLLENPKLEDDLVFISDYLGIREKNFLAWEALKQVSIILKFIELKETNIVQDSNINLIFKLLMLIYNNSAR